MAMIPAGHSGVELYEGFVEFLENVAPSMPRISDERFQGVFDRVIEWHMQNQDIPDRLLFEIDWSFKPISFSLSQEGIEFAEELKIEKQSFLVMLIELGKETRQGWIDDVSSN